MIRVAYGEKLAIKQADVKHQRLGDRIRIYAEDPYPRLPAVDPAA
jgi:acetyl/propionyl-CoA carboxylase alpha subunit